jgi:hypothetical protein
MNGKPLLLNVRREALNALDNTFSLDGEHFTEQSLGAFGRAPAQVAFTALRANQDPGPGVAKPLGGCLVGLDFILAIFRFSGHS